MVQIKFVKEIPVINGEYKKDAPHGDIGYQKWQVTKTYEVTMIYEITAKTRKEADELLERKEDPKEEIDDYGETHRETIKSRYYFDLSGDEPTEWKKIEECIPRNDEDMDNDYKPFLNYEDPDWSKDDFEWYKKEDGTNISK
jgi:hypothetical protein